MKLKNRFKS